MLPDWLDNDDQKIAWVNNKKNLLLKITKQRFEESVYEKLDEGGFDSIEELDDWLDKNMDALQRQRMAIGEYYDAMLSTLTDS